MEETKQWLRNFIRKSRINFDPARSKNGKSDPATNRIA
jgi:hypothetical protein